MTLPPAASVAPSLSRNDPCWCGSGSRFKACHGALGGAPSRDGPNTPNVKAVAERLAQAALVAQQADDLQLAESRYRECLALDPEHADAMHMLGVVRLAAFDFAEARALIETAGALTQWQFAQYRHNYGFLLSAYLPARSLRPTIAQRAALAALRARYPARQPQQMPVCAVLLHSVSEAWSGALQGSVQHEPTGVELRLLHCAPDPPGSSCPPVRALVGAVDADYIAFASADAPLDSKRLTELIALLEANQAGWGFSTAALAADALAVCRDWPAALSAAAAGLNNAQFSEQLTAMCVAAPLLPLSINNLVLRASLLPEISWQAPHLSHALGEMVLALCRRDEPCVCTSAPIVVTAQAARALGADFEAVSRAADQAQRRYLVDALANVAVANPLAPSLAANGLALLKRPLRYGAGAVLDAATLTDIAARIATLPINSKPLRDDGFDLVGFARAESGLGENLRALAHACAAAQVPHSVIDIDIDSGIRKADATLDALIAAAPSFHHQIICVNPDALNEAVHHEGVAAIGCAYKIGYWFWELEKLPLSWARASAALNELWASSEFVRQALANAVSIPVYKVPTPIRPPQPSRPYARNEFGLNNDDFVFLFSFAYGSVIARKNPWAVVRAFREAFPANAAQFSGARLVIKSVQSELFAPEKAALHALAGGDSRIIFMDRFLSRDQVMGLQQSADCYVSLHRSEGFGLGLAECMAVAKPAIATAYSGNLDFMNEGNSLLVDYSLIAVQPGEYPDTQDQVWADADVECAARQMRRVFADASLRERLGQAAQRYMHEHYSPAAVGTILRSHWQRLRELRNS